MVGIFFSKYYLKSLQTQRQMRKLLGKFKIESNSHMCNVNKFEIRQDVVCRLSNQCHLRFPEMFVY